MSNNLRVQQYQNAYQRRYYYLGKQQTDKYLLFDRQVNQVGVVSKAWVLEGIQKNCIDNAKVDRGQKIILISPIQAKYQNLVIDRLVQEMQKKPAQGSNSELEKQSSQIKSQHRQKQEIENQQNEYNKLENDYKDLDNKYGDAVRKVNDLSYKVQCLQGELDKVQKKYEDAYSNVQIGLALRDNKVDLSQSDLLDWVDPWQLMDMQSNIKKILNRQRFNYKTFGQFKLQELHEHDAFTSDLFACVGQQMDIATVMQSVYYDEMNRYEKIRPQDIQIHYRSDDQLRDKEKKKAEAAWNIMKALLKITSTIVQPAAQAALAVDEAVRSQIQVQALNIKNAADSVNQAMSGVEQVKKAAQAPYDNIKKMLDLKDNCKELIDIQKSDGGKALVNTIKAYKNGLNSSVKEMFKNDGYAVATLRAIGFPSINILTMRMFKNEDKVYYYVDSTDGKVKIDNSMVNMFYFQTGQQIDIDRVACDMYWFSEQYFFTQYFNLIYFDTLRTQGFRRNALVRLYNAITHTDRFAEITLDNLAKDLYVLQYMQQQQKEAFDLYKSTLGIVIAYFGMKRYLNNRFNDQERQQLTINGIPNLQNHDTWDIWQKAQEIIEVDKDLFYDIMYQYRQDNWKSIYNKNNQHIKEMKIESSRFSDILNRSDWRM